MPCNIKYRNTNTLRVESGPLFQIFVGNATTRLGTQQITVSPVEDLASLTMVETLWETRCVALTSSTALGLVENINNDRRRHPRCGGTWHHCAKQLIQRYLSRSLYLCLSVGVRLSLSVLPPWINSGDNTSNSQLAMLW